MLQLRSAGSVAEALSIMVKASVFSSADASRKTETANLHNFEMLKQALEDEIKFGGEDMDKAKAALAESGETLAAAEGDMAVTKKDLEADMKELADLHAQCMAKATEYEEGTKSRGEELKALAEAKKVLKETTGGAESQTYSLNQLSFFQIERAHMRTGVDLAHFEAVRFIR